TIAPNASAMISNTPSDFFNSDITYSLSVFHPCEPVTATLFLFHGIIPIMFIVSVVSPQNLYLPSV
ncbi:hypothetical protein R0K04_19705, partial [Pseudoalteromonas sp. SIMBA_153]